MKREDLLNKKAQLEKIIVKPIPFKRTEIYYYDENMNPCSEEESTHIKILEYENNQVVNVIMGRTKNKRAK